MCMKHTKNSMWCLFGKHIIGVIYDDMCNSRKIFKAKLKWCK